MISIAVSEASQIGEARREAAQLAADLGFDEAGAGRAALVANELASNLVKHAGGGEVLLDGSTQGLDVLAIDRGPGIANLKACMADGYSTAGTLGHGLGAVKRLAQSLEVVSWPRLGTAILARLARREAGPLDFVDEIGAVVIPKRGEEACGDAWSWYADGDDRVVFVVDGLGHGTEAALAAHEAVRQFQRSRREPADAVIQAVHAALKPTRGGAIAVARVDAAAASISFAGLGNIAAVAVGRDGRTRRMVSHNGTAGHNARKIQAFDYPFAAGLLVMHSDGIDTRWSLDRYPGLAQAHPLLIAGVIYRDHARERDDATVVILRLG